MKISPKNFSAAIIWFGIFLPNKIGHPVTSIKTAPGGHGHYIGRD